MQPTTKAKDESIQRTIAYLKETFAKAKTSQAEAIKFVTQIETQISQKLPHSFSKSK